LRKIVKFSGNENAWTTWKEKHSDFYNTLIDANAGDIFRFSLYDQSADKYITLNWVVVETENGYGFYDVDNRQGVDLPDWFAESAGMVSGAGLMKDSNHDGTYESAGSDYGDGVLMTPYTLPDGWKDGTNGNVILRYDLNWSRLGIDAVLVGGGILGIIAGGINPEPVSKVELVSLSITALGGILDSVYNLGTEQYIAQIHYQYRYK